MLIANKSVCIIKFKNKENTLSMGTGFFVELQYENEVLKGLMTNNHVLSKNQLKSKNDPIFEIYFDENKENFEINSNDMNFIFTEELIDITFIQFNDEIIKRINPFYLSIDNRKCVKMDQIMVIQYPVNKELLENIKNNKKGSNKNYNIKNFPWLVGILFMFHQILIIVILVLHTLHHLDHLLLIVH